MKGIKLLAVLMLSMFLCGINVLASEEEEEWKPSEPFFVEHMESCVEENRDYYANGPNGQVMIYESPASSKVLNILENGEIVGIDYTFTNEAGVTWGFCEFEGKFGWIPMPYLFVVYDYISFEEEYGEQFIIETDTIVPTRSNDLYWEFQETNKKIKFWTYPGSKEEFVIAFSKVNTMLPQYTKIFIDEDGRKWGFIPYYAGQSVNRWVCMSSAKTMVGTLEELYPQEEWMPVRDTRVMETYSGEEIFPDDYEEVQRMNKIRPIVIGIGIMALAGVAALFYWKMWKKVKEA